MAYNQQYGGGAGGARPQRQMFDVSTLGLVCGQCGKAITELPFQPTPGRPVFCFDCNKARRNDFPRRDRY